MSTTIDDTPVLTDDDLFRLWQRLMGAGGFARRSLWLIFLEEDGCPARLVIPIDDIPDSPEPVMIDNLVHMVDHLCGDSGVGSVPMLLSRPGSSTMTASDREWARCLTSALGDRRRWPIHLATRDHLQVFALDDLL